MFQKFVSSIFNTINKHYHIILPNMIFSASLCHRIYPHVISNILGFYVVQINHNFLFIHLFSTIQMFTAMEMTKKGHLHNHYKF